MKRFELSLLDKLFDDNPNGIDGPMVRSMSLDELKASVVRDLEALLNTRMVFSGERLAGFPECTKSVLTYGLDDFSGLSLASDNDRKFICASIRMPSRGMSPACAMSRWNSKSDSIRQTPCFLRLKDSWWSSRPTRKSISMRDCNQRYSNIR